MTVSVIISCPQDVYPIVFGAPKLFDISPATLSTLIEYVPTSRECSVDGALKLFDFMSTCLEASNV